MEKPPRFYTEDALPPDEGTVLRLDAEEGKHATRVLRLKEGDVVELCDGEGGVAKARAEDLQEMHFFKASHIY